MVDLNDRYLRCVAKLLEVMGPTDHDYLTVLGLQGRLDRAIAEVQQHGPTENARTEIARVTTELDRLCLRRLEQSFREFCGIHKFPEATQAEIRYNLPQPDYGWFIGREKELRKIFELLSPTNRHFLITVDGIGGVGKSALALEVAHRYLDPTTELHKSERFDAIVWTSAKRTTLTAEGIVPRKQALHTLDDIYTSISITLESQDITRTRLETQHKTVCKALTQQRVLLIVDNLETVDDETVMEFLRELPAPTKAIVTTRHRLDVAYPIRLKGMLWEDAKKLMDQECAKKSVAITDEQAYELYKCTGGVPLAVVWSVAQIGFGYEVEAVLERLRDPKGDIARFCFESTMARIRGGDAHKLLMALALFTSDADREALGNVAGLEEVARRDNGLVELEKLSLVNKSGSRFAMLPLTRSFSLYELEANPNFASEAKDRWVNQLTGLLRSQTGRYWIEDQARITQEGENFLSLLDWAMAHGDENMVLIIIRPSVLYLAYTARRIEALKLALNGKELAQRHGDKEISAWLSIEIGWILSQQKSPRQAIEQLNNGVKEYEQLNDDAGICFAKCLLAQALRHAERLSDAEKLLEEVLSEASRIGYYEGISIAEFEFGKLARERNEWHKAYEHFSAAVRALSQLDEASANMFSLTIFAIKGNRGTSALKLEKYNEAKKIFDEVLTILEDQRWHHLGIARDFNARMHLDLAEAETGLKNYPEATHHAERAKELYTSTKNQKGIMKAGQMLEKLGESEFLS